MQSTTCQESLWIYTSHISRYASIHRSSCGFCNAGNGVGGGRIEFQGGWRGPFPSVDAAVQQVLLNKRAVKEMRYCLRCL